jgi:hypothetical protein
MLFAHKVLAPLIVGSVLIIGCGKGEKKSVPASQTQVQHTIYHCAMHPQIVKDGPGDCPICGMALVPIETKISGSWNAGLEGAYPVIRVEGLTARRMGIRVTSPVRTRTPDSLGADVWSIPVQSLVRTGGRQVIVLYLGNGLYQPRDVKTGTETRTSIEILEGLEDEDRVVVSGQFLLMSQSELQAKGSNHE